MHFLLQALLPRQSLLPPQVQCCLHKFLLCQMVTRSAKHITSCDMMQGQAAMRCVQYRCVRMVWAAGFACRQHVDSSVIDAVGSIYPPADGTSAAAATIDNPDQRICDDIAAFVRSSTSITLSLCKKVSSTCSCWVIPGLGDAPRKLVQFWCSFGAS